MNWIDKLNYIFKLFIDKKTFIKNGVEVEARYWKIGTSIFNTFDRFLEKIKDVDISKDMYVKYNKYNLTTQGKNNSYILELDNKNVTPCKVRGYTSDAAIHQYIRMFESFSLATRIDVAKNNKEFIDKSGRIKLSFNIRNLLDNSNRLELLIRTIVNSFYTNVQDKRDIAYSIVIEFLLNKDFDFGLLDSSNRIFKWKKAIGKLNRKTDKCADLLNDKEKILNDINNQGSIATYKEIINLLNQKYKSVEDFINEIYDRYQYSLEKNNDKYFDQIQQQIKTINLKSMIKNERSKFKDNIFENRKSLNLISNKNDLYCDIVDINNVDNMEWHQKFNECEACHIYNVYQIAREILNNNKTEYLEFISNPNNGIIMPLDYHDSFDRDLWTFDSNGKMIIPIENKEYLLKNKGLKEIKIRDEILNNEMINFLNMR